jgi:hypothetical protein
MYALVLALAIQVAREIVNTKETESKARPHRPVQDTKCYRILNVTSCDSDAVGHAGGKVAAEDKAGRRACRFTERRHEADVVQVLKSISIVGGIP